MWGRPRGINALRLQVNYLMRPKILWIEGKRADSPSFIPGLRKKGYIIETVPTGKAAVARIPSMNPNLVVLNAASMRTSGKRICQSIHDQNSDLPVLVIASPDHPLDGDECANVILNLPFTVRKLVNRIIPLLPAKEEDLIKAGPIKLDVERNQVHTAYKETRLTPRMVGVLKILMKHAGEVVDREDLFRKVWNTEYTGDTRTLDVHISWLRRAIEEDPRNPRLLKTIRGVGYRLDV
jgi:DNA-binding response OmpR family regulator